MKPIMVANRIVTRLVVAGLIVPLIPPGSSAQTSSSAEIGPTSRTFQFDYGATLQQLPAEATVRVWLPVPPTSDHQTIKRIASSLPVTAKHTVEPVYGNQIVYFESKVPRSGKLSFQMSYEVRRSEVHGLAASDAKPPLRAEVRKRFLSANQNVPLRGKPLTLLAGIDLPRDALAIAHTLYQRVDDHVRYDKSIPGYGNGDVLWVCDSRCGNCTDFHSLFISLARANGLPARFEIGFLLPQQRGEGTIGGYHCWALFHNDQFGWVPVDISEADKHPEKKSYYFGNLTENRITFTTGRDIRLVPKQAGQRLNFLVYPYVEVNGKPLAADKMKMRFQYRDL